MNRGWWICQKKGVNIGGQFWAAFSSFGLKSSLLKFSAASTPQCSFKTYGLGLRQFLKPLACWVILKINNARDLKYQYVTHNVCFMLVNPTKDPDILCYLSLRNRRMSSIHQVLIVTLGTPHYLIQSSPPMNIDPENNTAKL